MTRIEAQLRVVRAVLAMLDGDETAYRASLDGWSAAQFGELLVALVGLLGALTIDAHGSHAGATFQLRALETRLEEALAAVTATQSEAGPLRSRPTVTTPDRDYLG